MFVMAIVVGAASHVPGALGVFEGAMVLQLQPPTDLMVQVIGALLVFRAIYYILPLCLGSGLLAAVEIGRWRSWLQSSGERAFRWVSLLVPTAAAGLVVLAGAVLLLSGATPEVHSRLVALSILVPTAVIAVAHYLGSLIGVVLLFLARPLRRRVRGAWSAAVVLLGAGVATTVLKGLDSEAAALLLLVLLILLPLKAEFYRQSRLVEERVSSGWWAIATIVVLAALWLAFFGLKYPEHGQGFWWQSGLHPEAPRSLHATLAALALLAGLSLASLFRRSPAGPHVATPQELALAREVVLRDGDADSWLALAGDKAVHFDPTGRAFISYGVSGGSWIAMGEPVGPPDLWPKLVWDFHEAADRHGAYTAFYEVGSDSLPLLLDLGLEFVELGERARVPLAEFDLRGKRRADLRNARNRAAKSGVQFTVLEPEEVPAVLDELEAVSAAWLSEHGGQERHFSQGFFCRDYVAGGPVAVLGRAGAIVAFSNLWLSADGSEASMDLVRSAGEGAQGAMSLLVAETMLWAKQGGFQWFLLGVAPSREPGDHRLSVLWPPYGRPLLRHGAQFHDARGLRAFMEKLDPVWEPVFLLHPARALPEVLADLTALIVDRDGAVVRR